MLKKVLFLSAIAATFISCGGSKETAPAETTAVNADSANKPESQPENELADFKFHMAVANIPSPFEIIDLLPKSGLAFDKGLLNPTENLNKYQTTTKRALCYGVYVVDLIYLSSNEQYSEIKQFFITSRELAQKLEAGDSFNAIAGTRIEKNIDNKDSVNQVMDAVYAETDNYLRSNARLLAATQILTGSWIESQYITLNLLKNVEKNGNNEALFVKVYEQQVHAENLVKLLAEFEKEKDFKYIIDGVKDLAAMYKELKSDSIDKSSIEKISTRLTALRTIMVS